MRLALEELAAVNVRRYERWCRSEGIDATRQRDEYLVPPLDSAGLADLAAAAGAPIPEPLAVLLATPDARLGLGFGAAGSAALDFEFAWLDNAAMVGETRNLRDAAERYGWRVPACVVLSAESSEVIAYRLADRALIHVAADSDGDVTEIDVTLAELVDATIAASHAELAADE